MNRIIDKIPTKLAVVVAVIFLCLVGYGVYKQYKNGFVSPYYFGS